MKTILIIVIATFASFTTFAQKEKGKVPTTKSTMTIQSTYVCPMHPDVVSSQPGKCPKCNMDLTLSKKEQMKKDAVKIYTCPMHTDVVSNVAGTCPQCNRSLTLSKKEGMKMDVMDKMYTCPMHKDVAVNTKGKCPICGMAMAAVKTKAKS